MDLMKLETISPDQVIFWRWGWAAVNLTLLTTWVVMALITLGSWWVTRRLSAGTRIPRWQNLLEVIVDGMRRQIREIGQQDHGMYLPFIGTLFVFIAMCNLLTILPGYVAPTSSLSTTTALAVCVFVAVPVYGVRQQGWWGYLKGYVQPTPFMLPFQVVGELSRTLALAVRLFGNIMSGAKIAAILLAIVPLIFPVVLQAFGLLTGMIQAYIFAVLSMVYIASATRAHHREDGAQASSRQEKGETAHG